MHAEWAAKKMLVASCGWNRSYACQLRVKMRAYWHISNWGPRDCYPGPLLFGGAAVASPWLNLSLKWAATKQRFGRNVFVLVSNSFSVYVISCQQKCVSIRSWGCTNVPKLLVTRKHTRGQGPRAENNRQAEHSNIVRSSSFFSSIFWCLGCNSRDKTYHKNEQQQNNVSGGMCLF